LTAMLRRGSEIWYRLASGALLATVVLSGLRYLHDRGSRGSTLTLFETLVRVGVIGVVLLVARLAQARRTQEPDQTELQNEGLVP